MMEIRYFGPDNDFMRTALADLDEGFSVERALKKKFALENSDGSVVTKFTGKSFNYSDEFAGLPTTGKAFTAVFEQDSAPVAEVEGVSWSVLNLFFAMFAYFDSDSFGPLEKLFNRQDISFDASEASSGFQMDILGLSFRSAIEAVGSRHADQLYGGTKADVIDGGRGKDDVAGRGGNDELLGRAGNDTPAGEGGNDNLLGGAGRDSLDGGTGADTLKGGAGRDTLVGGKGNDDLTGGGGPDQFVYDADSTQGSDVIRDFSVERDSLVVEGFPAFVRLEPADGGDSTTLIIADLTTILMEDVTFGTFTAADIDIV